MSAPEELLALVKPERIVELCRERAATYGDLRQVSPTALALDAAADEIERLRALQGWRDIESAPRDGTQIIVGRNRVELGNGAYKEAIVLEARWGEFADLGRCWIFGNALDPWRVDPEHPPTHWQPLPPPPEQADG